MKQTPNYRNQDGLLSNINYVYADDGFIDWRAMIKQEYLYPNRDFFELRGQPVPSSIEGLADKQLLIMLGGIKELAKLRGYKSISYDLTHVDKDYVVAKCKINWIANYETSGIEVAFEDVANATSNNTDDFCLKFLETIACNRAFVRAVRNFLNIHIVGADEIDKSKNKVVDAAELMTSSVVPITAQRTLEKLAHEKLKITDFDSFKAHLRSLWKKAQESNDEKMLDLLTQAKEWSSFDDVPAKSARILIKNINA
jgi:hypothetical protein